MLYYNRYVPILKIMKYNEKIIFRRWFEPPRGIFRIMFEVTLKFDLIFFLSKTKSIDEINKGKGTIW